VIALLGLFAWSLCLGPSAALAENQISRAVAATVHIEVDLGGGRGSSGSGVVISPGHVLTAAHVVDGGQGGEIVGKDGKNHGFTVAWADPTTDLAVLNSPDLALTPVELGDSAKLQDGDPVWAIGFPLGMDSVSVTKGVVSSARQVLDGQPYIQTDAAINPGNSGGPLVDEKGKLVGTNVSKTESTQDGRPVEGMGFAVPLATAQAGAGQYFGADAASAGGGSGSSAGPSAGSGPTSADPFAGSTLDWHNGTSDGSASGADSNSGAASDSGGSGGALLGILAVLVLLGGGGALAWWLMRRRGGPPRTGSGSDWDVSSPGPSSSYGGWDDLSSGPPSNSDW
jgi:S1-C subfamily serine protease